MKTCKLLLLIALLAVCSYSKSQSKEQFPFKNSHKVTVSSNDFKFIEKGYYIKPIPALEIGYLCVAQPYDSNFYLELGAGLMCAYGNVAKTKTKVEDFIIKKTTSISLFSITVPLNFGYNIKLSDETSLSPYIGVYQRINIAGCIATKVSSSPDKGVIKKYERISKSGAQLFLENEETEKLNRHQVGVLGGLKVNYNEFSCGITYGYDFLGFDEHTKSMSWGLNFGYTF